MRQLPNIGNIQNGLREQWADYPEGGRIDAIESGRASDPEDWLVTMSNGARLIVYTDGNQVVDFEAEE